MGPLKGLKVIEFAGIGPGPMAAMLLADMGATVLRLERPAPSGLGLSRPTHLNFLNRGRRSVVLDLKRPEGVSLAMSLVEKADALIEGFRPGTMERLGLGPGECLARNRRIVYGRVTGWGQDGPLAQAAGHDLNYIALSGALDAIGRRGQPPTPPLNLVGDYGGAVYLCMGMLAARIEAQLTGLGQVVDAAMVDAATSLMASTYGLRAAGMHEGPRGTNMLDSGAPYYDVYECSDGKYISIAPIEAKFREQLFALLGLPERLWALANDPEGWPALRAELATRFRRENRDHWCRMLEGTDACFAPVLSMDEAPIHPHQRARHGFVEIGGVAQPAPAPRFSRTVNAVPTAPEPPGASADAAMAEWGFSKAQIDDLRRQGALLRRTDGAQPDQVGTP
ncbi:CaiB/BaiF CoA-transferase family protein [Xanthobacter sp. DSM 24535]|uniref:CaiB/BaiF CoA transferase family protein n=1 Tax=Roseixanthobacter psychrophilus TaxID=3119917 RepID=UPI00372C6A09